MAADRVGIRGRLPTVESQQGPVWGARHLPDRLADFLVSGARFNT
ncbi:hypothetical protein [Streptomyces violaceusniger]|uniref:Uncharacterized protein n=1 Tax=Streptomyces violaceusniger TaxID=68280 RepID=A0A4D4LAH8_STRVO|nr:hypothetical protein SVIO_087480 [Streptomyces violaceusniger]